MEKKKIITFHDGFFSQTRPTVSTKEALKDVTPINWSTDVINGKNKIVLKSNKNKS